MTQLTGKEIRILTKNYLYNSYPFAYDFALTLLYKSLKTLGSNSLKELLFFICFLSLDENTNEVNSQTEFFNQEYDIFSCMNTDFVVKHGVLYYLNFKPEIYFNLENLEYQDRKISSIMYKDNPGSSK
jgi:hypothetical protein